MSVFSKEVSGYLRDAEELGRLQATTMRLEDEGAITQSQSLAAREAFRDVRRQVICKIVLLTDNKQ